VPAGGSVVLQARAANLTSEWLLSNLHSMLRRAIRFPNRPLSSFPTQVGVSGRSVRQERGGCVTS